MSVNDTWLVTSSDQESPVAIVIFLVEGVMLLVVATVGLVGNILSFLVLSTKGLQKTFHNLLLLLNIFDMVGTFSLISCFNTQGRKHVKLTIFLFIKILV